MLELFFPPTCLLCDRSLDSIKHPRLCSFCRQQMAYIKAPHCLRCLQSFQSLAEEKHLCGTCLQGGYFRRLYSVAWYQGGLTELLKQLKFQRRLDIAPTLGGLLAEIDGPQLALSLYDCIVPVPLDRDTLRRRGFNQSALLGKSLAQKHALRLDRLGLRKHKKTATQSTLKAAERTNNVQGAFIATRSFHGESCLLVDDIFTTGATAEACAMALRKAGALAVDVLTVARAV